MVMRMLMVGRSEARAAQPPHHQPMEGESGPPLLARRWLHSGSREVVLVCQGGSISHQLPPALITVANSCQFVHVYM